jgi:hypothetical protein
MVHLVAVLRNEPRLEHLGRCVSHISLVLSHSDRCVSVTWSEPGGIAWAGEQGFVVERAEYRERKFWARAVVEERGVVAAVLERLESAD